MPADLGVQPEEGLEVIVTGKLTIYGGRSKYRIVLQQMEVAGEGARFSSSWRNAVGGLRHKGRCLMLNARSPFPPHADSSSAL